MSTDRLGNPEFSRFRTVLRISSLFVRFLNSSNVMSDLTSGGGDSFGGVCALLISYGTWLSAAAVDIRPRSQKVSILGCERPVPGISMNVVTFALLLVLIPFYYWVFCHGLSY